MPKVVPTVPRGGNTISPLVTKGLVKKQISCSKNWCFTLNNYTEDDINMISSIVPEICTLCVVGKEVGASGTPHLQGFCSFKVKCRPMSLLLSPKIHWEKCKGNAAQNIAYCEKDDDVIIRHGLPAKIKVHKMERQWQLDILDKIKEEPNDRELNWIWSEAGGTRKTSTCKYLAVKHGAVILGGKAADVRNAVCEYVKKNGETPKLIVINIPRSFAQEYVSYEAFENLKDMCFYSGKYEGGMVCGNSPHVFIMANFHPDEEKCSSDRWKIINIDEKKPEMDLDLSDI